MWLTILSPTQRKLREQSGNMGHHDVREMSLWSVIKRGQNILYWSIITYTLFSRRYVPSKRQCTDSNFLVRSKYWRLESWIIQPSKKSYSVSKLLIMLQMILHQNNETTRNGRQYVTINVPVTLNFIFSYPLDFNVIMDYTWL